MPTKSEGKVTSRPIVNVTLTDIRRRYQWVVGKTKRADVIVHKRGTPIFVLLSIRRYMEIVTALRHFGAERPSRWNSAGTDQG